MYKVSIGARTVVSTLFAASLTGCLNLSSDDTTPTNPTTFTNTLTHRSQWPSIESRISADSAIEARALAILQQMTLEEKVGQMIQPNLDDVSPEEAKQYKLGSLLNGGGSWPDKNKHASAQQWADKADEYWLALDEAYADRGFKIPFMWATDAVHGHNNVFRATVFPHNIGLGAARDPELIERIGAATAREVAATGLDWTFAPTVAAPRDLRWGRTYEGYSEDPQVIYDYAGRMVQGLQGGAEGLKTDTKVISNVKHWIGDGGTVNGVDRGENRYSEEYLINLHAAGYFSGLTSGAQVVMSSFNSWQDDKNVDHDSSAQYNKKVHGSKYLITDILKGKLGFDGLVITDWNGHTEINDCSATNCPAAVLAGNDIFMVTANADWKGFRNNVIAQVNDGTIPIARINDAVTRILRVKMRAGLWEKPKPSARSLAGKQDVLGSAEHRQLAREAVRKSLVMLKNEGAILPLKTSQKFYLAGSAINNLEKQTGGWSLTWQGTENTLDDFPGASTIKMAIESLVPAENIVTDLSATDNETVALVAIGEVPYAEFFGDIKAHQTLGFATLRSAYAADLQIIKDLKARGMKVVTLFLSGRPMYVNEEINHSDAFVAAWLPGTEAGGITDVLFSVDNIDFTGRLSFSWPNKVCDTSINRVPPNIPNYVTPDFEQDINGGHAPLFAYGYDLSYGDLSDASLNTLTLDSRDYGCGQSAPDTSVATSPLEVYGKSSGGEYILRISGAANGWAPIAVSNLSETDQGDVKTTPVNYQGQYDAINVAFDGDALAQIYLQTEDEAGQDKSSLLNAESTLQFDINVHEAPSAALSLAQHCVHPCLGQINNINDSLPAAGSGWKTLKIPLQCFSETGMNYTLMNTPFLFLTSGTAKFDFGNVRIVPKSIDAATDALNCADIGGATTTPDGGNTGTDNTDLGTLSDGGNVSAVLADASGDFEALGGNTTVTVKTSDKAIDGDSSINFSHSGMDWGGIFVNLSSSVDASTKDWLILSLYNAPSTLSYLELKLESGTGDGKPNAIVNLMNYTPADNNGWKVFSIPTADFSGIDFAQLSTIGFWHPKDSNDTYVAVDLLIDHIHFADAAYANQSSSVDLGTLSDGGDVSAVLADASGNFEALGGNTTVTVKTSDKAIDGDSSINFSHSGMDWGGIFVNLSSSIDASAKDWLILSLYKAPSTLSYLELKLESGTGDGKPNAIVNLMNYTPADNNGWKVFSIPTADFSGIDFTQLSTIGFWHPKDSNDTYVAVDLLIDHIHFADAAYGDQFGTLTDTPAPDIGVALYGDSTDESAKAELQMAQAPTVTIVKKTSTKSFQGTSSVYFSHSGEDWGGIFAGFSPVRDLDGSTAKTELKIALYNVPSALADLTLKIENSTDVFKEVNILSFNKTESNGWQVYTIPVSEFSGVDLSAVSALGIWHPKNSAGTFIPVELLIDDIHFQ